MNSTQSPVEDFANILSTVQEAYLVLDGDFRFTFINRAAETLLGTLRVDLIGKTPWEIRPESAGTALEEGLRRAKAENAVVCFENYYEPWGRWYSITSMPDSQGGFVVHFLDSTERKRAELALLESEKALRKSEEKFSKAFQSSPAATTLADLATGTYLEVNAAFEALTGYRRDEVIGKRWDRLGLWTDPGRRDEAVRQLLRDGHLRNFEFKFRRSNGDVGTGLLSAELIEIDGNPCAITASIDITERLKVENELRQSQKLESIGRLAGGVAHDFNNLLTVINGYAEFLATGLDPQHPLWSSADEIRKAGERAAGLTGQLLAFSRKEVREPEILDLNGTILDSKRMLQRLIGEPITLATKLDPHLGRVMADPNQIHQVIMNLAVNARDAMPDGGTICIETANLELDGEGSAAFHPGATPGRYVVITVTDTGNGMDESILPQIFEPFFTTKEAGKGTGLGLSTVYGIVRQNAGWIDVSSTLGAGTSFKICLPRIDRDSVEERRGDSRRARTYGGETILVVEDHEAVRQLIKAILQGYGYNILVAANAEQALDIAREHSEIHLLLTDVVLPGLNGKQLSERMKTLRPELKVLLTSGYTADAFGDWNVADSGFAYIPKPFTTVALAAKVRDVLAGGSAPQ